jgi:hypothetical protein
MSVFLEIQPVIEFSGENTGAEKPTSSGYHCGNKVIGEMGLRRKAGLFRRKTFRQSDVLLPLLTQECDAATAILAVDLEIVGDA